MGPWKNHQVKADGYEKQKSKKYFENAKNISKKIFENC
jgi:hypothetical protein